MPNVRFDGFTGYMPNTPKPQLLLHCVTLSDAVIIVTQTNLVKAIDDKYDAAKSVCWAAGEDEENENREEGPEAAKVNTVHSQQRNAGDESLRACKNERYRFPPNNTSCFPTAPPPRTQPPTRAARQAAKSILTLASSYSAASDPHAIEQRQFVTTTSDSFANSTGSVITTAERQAEKTWRHHGRPKSRDKGTLAKSLSESNRVRGGRLARSGESEKGRHGEAVCFGAAEGKSNANLEYRAHGADEASRKRIEGEIEQEFCEMKRTLLRRRRVEVSLCILQVIDRVRFHLF